MALKLIVLAFYVAAVASVGFAHRSANSTPIVLDLTAFVLPGGSAPVICGDMADGEAGRGDQHANPLCDVCQLVAAPGLVSAADCGVAVRRPSLALAAGGLSDRVPVRGRSHVAHLRGPPGPG